MKRFSSISAAAVLAATFAAPVWAGPVGVERNAPTAQSNPAQTQASAELIAKLQDASQQARREGRTGNKNNIEFVRKSAQIDDLVDRLKSGQKVDPSEIDQALQPTQVW